MSAAAARLRLNSCTAVRVDATVTGMIIARLASVALVLSAPPAMAVERVFAVGSYEQVRIDGPFEVRIITGASPRAKVEGDRELIERLNVSVTGGTLTVRIGNGGWGERPANRDAAVPVVTLSTPRLSALSVSAGGQASVSRMAGQKLRISVAGSASVDVQRVEADEFSASLLGSGEIKLAGQANRAHLSTDGAGVILASALSVNDLVVHLAGPGETQASARNTAQVTSTGLGAVTVQGKASCTIRAIAGARIRCGEER